MKAPRLHQDDHKISSALITLVGKPTALFATIFIIVGYVFSQVFIPGFDILWALPKLILVISSMALLIGMLDIISNIYQEVSADDRHREIMEVLASQHAATVKRIESLEHTVETHNVTIL